MLSSFPATPIPTLRENLDRPPRWHPIIIPPSHHPISRFLFSSHHYWPVPELVHGAIPPGLRATPTHPRPINQSPLTSELCRSRRSTSVFVEGQPQLTGLAWAPGSLAVAGKVASSPGSSELQAFAELSITPQSPKRGLASTFTSTSILIRSCWGKPDIERSTQKSIARFSVSWE